MEKSSVTNEIVKIEQDKNGELEKDIVHVIDALIEYIPNAVLSRTIIKKSTGNITAMSFAKGEELGEKSVPFDTYIQVIDGTAQITTLTQTHRLPFGSGIVIPAHQVHGINANEQFKMLSTVIKSGYESMPL